MAYIQRTKPSRKPLNIILRRQQENILKTKEKIRRRAKAGLETSQQRQQKNQGCFHLWKPQLPVRVPGGTGMGQTEGMSAA